MEYIKTDDSVYFTTNFYHPASGYSIAPDAIPAYLVYESGYSLILQGGMTAKPTIVGSYWGTFVASTANGFFSDRFYDVQVSGAVTVNGELISRFSQVKNFVVNDIFDANMVQVSGQYVSMSSSIDANIVKVSGETVSINDFVGAASIADAVWDETLSDHDTPGGAGHALVTASGNLISGDWSTHATPDLSALATGTNLEAVSGVLVARTRLDADYFSWTSDPVSVSGIVDANVVQVSGEYISLTSGAIDANVTQVSGEYVDIGQMQGSAGLTTSNIADAVWTEVIADHTGTAGGAAQALVTASGNLIGSTSVSAADIADAVWDENLADHAGGTSTGQALVTASGNLIGSTSVSAVDIRTEMDANSLQFVAISGNVAGLAGAAMRGTDSAALASSLESVSGVVVSRTLPSGEYFNSAYNADIYFAGIKYISDLSNDSDEFAVHWFKNDQPVSSGDLTNPAISVYNTNTGAAVFENQAMSYAASNLGVVRYNNTPMILASGEPYLVETSGTIDAGTRTWRAVVGTDLL